MWYAGGQNVIFPEAASWQKSQGEVIPIYEDFNGRGVSYTLVGFWNLRTKSTIRISEIHNEIAPKNRICTMEQAAVYVKAVENFMEDMWQGESSRTNLWQDRTVLFIGQKEGRRIGEDR